MKPFFHLRVLLVLACASACADGDGTQWSQADEEAIYAAALGVVQARMEEGDSVWVDSRPRFLVGAGEEMYRMGEFNRFGDYALEATVADDPRLLECPRGTEGTCAGRGNGAAVFVSEVLRVGPKEAVVLLSYELRGAGLRAAEDLFVQLRSTGGTWRVSRVGEGETVEIPGVDSEPR